MRWTAIPILLALAACSTTPPPEPPMSSCVVDSYVHGTAHTAVAVDFDGTDDYLTLTGLDGVSDTKQVTGSFWINLDADDTLYRIFTGATSGFQLRFFIEKPSSGDNIHIWGLNASSVVVLDVSSSDNTIKAASGWQHVMFSFDLSDTNKRHLYIDEASSLSTTSYTNNNMDIDASTTLWAVGASTSGSLKLNGQLSEFYIDFGTYIDLSIEANRRKFIDAAGKPVSLGSDGSTPTGMQPTICLNNALATWQENNGYGGDFTENGTLGAAASSPSD